jgi:hypothetical protein
MNQQLKNDPRETGLTTADLAKTNQQASMDEAFNRSAMGTSTRRSSGNGPFVHEDDAPFVRDEVPFPDERDEDERYEVEEMDSSAPGEIPEQTARTLSKEDHTAAPLFSSEESSDFHARWDSVQVSFVDEPRRAVQLADGLVASAMKRLAEIFAEERASLDKQWDRGEDVSTEDLRQALRRYRSFFGRLLSV